MRLLLFYGERVVSLSSFYSVGDEKSTLTEISFYNKGIFRHGNTYCEEEQVDAPVESRKISD